MVPGRDFIGVGVGGMIFNREGLAFFAKRGDAATNEKGSWEFPGGRVEYGEKLTDAIKREFVEEYGLEIEITMRLGAFDHILTEEQQHWVSITFVGNHVSGVAKILEPDKCSAIGWFSLSAPPTPLTRVTKENLERYRAKHGDKAECSAAIAQQ
jgi:8-oxo-dGTP diphosphatase